MTSVMSRSKLRDLLQRMFHVVPNTHAREPTPCAHARTTRRDTARDAHYVRTLHESERSKAILLAPRRRRGRGAHGQGGELLLAKSRVSRAPPTRAVAPGLVARLPALEDDQDHSRGRRTGTRRPEMLRAETDRAGELQHALGRAAQAAQRQA